MSSFRCFGRGAVDGGRAEDRFCELRNVCFFPEHSGLASFFRGSRAVQASLGLTGVIPAPPDPVALLSASALFSADPLRVRLEPEGSQAPPESSRAWVNGTAVLVSQVAHDANLGHLLWEDSYAAWALAQAIPSFAASPRMVLRQSCGEFHADSQSAAARCRRLHAAFGKALSPHPPVGLKELGGRLGTASGEVCFRQLVAGTTPFGIIHHKGSTAHAVLVPQFRCALLTAHGLSCGLGRAAAIQQGRATIHIIVTRKASGVHGPERGICNPEEAAGWLRDAFDSGSHQPEAAYGPLVRVRVIEWTSLGSVEAELKELSETSVVVSPCGGVSMMLGFLPAGAHAVISDYWSPGPAARPWDASSGSSEAMEGHVWALLPTLTVTRYEILDPATDVVLADGFSPDAAGFRNHACTVLQRDRLLRHVLEAVRGMLRRTQG